MTPNSMRRSGSIAMTGGALWTLLPAGLGAVTLHDVRPATLGWVAVSSSYWLFAVLAPLLIVVGLRALRSALGTAAGRLGRTGIGVSAVGLTAMAVGNGIEVASLTSGGGEVALGHIVFLVGWLVSTLGAALVGIVVFRRRSDRLARAGGLLLALTLPLGIGLGLLADAVIPGSDAGFWAAIAIPTGVAWVLLGRSLAATSQATASAAAAVG